MALFFLLLALLGGAVVGDLIWENTAAGEVTVLDRTLVSYPQGWLLAAAAGIGFVTALLLVASVSSTRTRRERRRQLRDVKRHPQREGTEPELEHASWLEEAYGRQETATDAGEPPTRHAEPLYEQTGRAAGRHDDLRSQWPSEP
jgi:Lipopolysaccharide assembly protein A domain